MNKRQPPKLERTYKTKITYMCPVRGQVTEEVEVKVYQSVKPHEPSPESEMVASLLRQEGLLSEDDEL